MRNERSCNNCTHKKSKVEIVMNLASARMDYCELNRPLEINGLAEWKGFKRKRGRTKCEEYKPTLVQRIKEKLG